MTVLVVAAHPDDEVLGCGATIARLAKEGHEIYIATMSEGITSRYQQREQVDMALVESLHARSHQVAKMLGAKDTYMQNLPDNCFDTVPLLDIIKSIEALIARVTPEIIYTHHGGDLNIDHAVIYRAVLTATRPVEGCPVRELYAFEVPSSTEWAFQQFTPVFKPNTFVDISATLETKIKAMSLYESEARKFPHPRSPEALRTMAQWRGSLVGYEAAEAFELIRAIK